MIDISGYINFNSDTTTADLGLKKSVSTLKSGPLQPQKDEKPAAQASVAKPIPGDYLTVEEKSALKDIHHEIFQLIDDSVKIRASGPLIVEF